MTKKVFVKRFSLLLASAACVLSSQTLAAAAVTASTFPTRPLRAAVVNFKTCVEASKLGKQEQGTFEAMKKQMEAILGEKEKTLNEITAKLSDADYLDSLSPDAETEIKRKFRSLSQELSQSQNQYFQTLQQANFKIIQNIGEIIEKASAKVAKDLKIDLVYNQEGTFYHAEDLDISALVVAEMDILFEKELKDSKALPAAGPNNVPPALPKPAAPASPAGKPSSAKGS